MTPPGQSVDKSTAQPLRGWTNGDYSLVQARDADGQVRQMLRGPSCGPDGTVCCFFLRPARPEDVQDIEELQRRSTQGAA